MQAELVALTRKTLGAVPLLRQALAPLAAQLHTAYIYGSVARQTDTAHSDIDLMLVGTDIGLADVLPLLLPLEPSLGRKINPNLYTPEQYAKRLQEPDSFIQRVLAQPTLMLWPLPDETGGA